MGERNGMQELAQLYEIIVERSPLAIMVTRGTGPLFYNRAYLTMLGFGPKETPEFAGPFAHIHPEDRPMVLEYNRRRIAGEEAPSTYEVRMVRKDGGVIEVEINASRIIYRGEPAALAFIRDVTLRKKVSQALKESEEKYRQVVENAIEAIFIVQDERIRFCNHATLELTGVSFEELSHRSFIEFIHSEDRGMVYMNYQKRLQGEEVPSSYEFRIVDAEGDVKWVELNVVGVEWEGRPATLNFLHEITAKKELEARLFGLRKMEAIGTLAGGMAHDFNNILMGIMGHTALMLLETDKSHPHHGRLKAIETQVLAGAELTKQLLGYARAGRYELALTNVNEILRHTVRLLWQARKGIKMRQDYYPLLWPVEADKEQLEEVFRQIFLNAWRAMPEGGTLGIKTENVVMESTELAPYHIPAGRYVRVTISDTGVGMDEEVRARLFEPYFTTREMGHGVGLGLAAVYGIVKGHGGFIDVQSKKGEGTSFYVYFPASSKGFKDIPGSPVEKEGRTILLIEDEKMIADVTKAMLTQLGYEVSVAPSGEKGIEMFREMRPHLVILDMVMPGMGGEEVYRQLRAIDAEVKVLLASGYAVDEKVKRLLAGEKVGFIQKPYRLQELAEKVSDLWER
ncbi:MAG TPA: PAS domain S-box protein [Syntrophales bacterium]|nr:PAS domain S-box protein [Syntrophales bacterium]HOL59782.1 PAS domain S-box protein [Syntrophales bacterium]HPO35908.1 PAS domain S-box protein [Syntrophales bacterium]